MQQQQQIQQLIRLLQSYQETIDVLNQQKELVNQTIDNRRQATEALTSLQDLDAPGEIMVPVGGSQFVYASVEQTDRVLSSIGSEVVVEEDLDSAIDRNEDRIDQLEDGRQQIQDRIDEVTEEAEEIQQRVQELYRQQQP